MKKKYSITFPFELTQDEKEGLQFTLEQNNKTTTALINCLLNKINNDNMTKKEELKYNLKMEQLLVSQLFEQIRELKHENAVMRDDLYQLSKDYFTPKDAIVAKVIEAYKTRSEVGITKYGTTLEDNNTDDFLQHLQEELMDATLYIEKLKEIASQLNK